MLKKLLKYDLKWCFKPLVVFYLLACIFAILVRVIESFDQSLFLLIMDKICCGALIAMVINIIINCFMRNWARFIKNIYKDESYLTHTLPIARSQIYLSKVLTAIITLLTSFIVIVGVLAISSLNADTWAFLKNTLEQSAIYFNTSIIALVMTFICTVFFQFLYMIMSGIVGIIIGHKSNNLRIVKSILLGFAIYYILSSLSIGIVFISGLISPDIMTMFTEVVISSNVIKTVLIIITVSYAIYNIVLFIIGNKMLNKGVNVD